MAFDACMMRAVLTEIANEFPNAKIEKVLQPRNDEVDLLIHSGRKNSRLVFNVGPNAPRLQLSSSAKENPLKAPMFCMLLRKHLIGARITEIEQTGFDRIAKFRLSCYDDMGFKAEKILICEIMGKYANLILTDGEEKVIAALKVIDFAASTVRQVLPGLRYQIPEKPEKLYPLEINRTMFLEKLSGFPKEKTVEKFITAAYSGIATQIARELAYRASGRLDAPICEVNADKLLTVFEEWQQLLISENYLPTAVTDADGKPIDYSYMDITYQGVENVKHFASFSELFDMYFAERDRRERIHQRAHDLITLLSNATARTERKLAIQREALLESANGEKYKKAGELITANLYRIERGMDSFTAIDYYDEACPEIEIKLDPRLHPSQNAQRMYKLYSKAKTAREVLTKQIAIWEAELLYLESVRAFLDSAESEEDLTEIREELYRSGYASKLKDYRPQKSVKLRPIEYTTSGGYTLLVGRNNIQNDSLSLKTASKDDIWFHVKDMPGSHVILVTGGAEPSEKDYTEAAAVALVHSKAGGDLYPVDYTKVKNLKKPAGSKPGFVIYKTNYTAYVKKSDADGVKRKDAPRG